MASTGVNVLRWGALTFGIFYGFTHQRAITSRDTAAAAQHEYDHKTQLINQAKAEFAKKNAPSQESGIISDPSDPKFDLEAYLKNVAAQNP